MTTSHGVEWTPSVTLRKQPLLTPTDSAKSSSSSSKKNPSSKHKMIGEFAGGTTAECAAVVCCCPCTVMNLLVLAVYKVPAGLCKKAWRKQRLRRRMAKRKQVGGFLVPPTVGSDLKRELLKESGRDTNVTADVDVEDEDLDLQDLNEEEIELEKEMWDRFCGAGFWRSHSDRELSFEEANANSQQQQQQPTIMLVQVQ